MRYGEKSYRFRREDVETFIQNHTVSVRLSGLERLEALTGVAAPMARPDLVGARPAGRAKGWQERDDV